LTEGRKNAYHDSSVSIKGQVDSLPSVVRLHDLGWINHDGQYQYNAGPSAPIGEVNVLENVLASYSFDEHYLLSLKLSEESPDNPKIDDKFEAPVLMFCLHVLNAAHMLSHVISFVNFYLAIARETPLALSGLRVAIPGEVHQRIPLVFEILQRLLPGATFVLLETNKSYLFRQLVLRRNTLFTALSNWGLLQWTLSFNVLTFKDLSWIRPEFFSSDDVSPLLNLTNNAYAQNQHRAALHEKIIVFKLASGAYMHTPQRAITLTTGAENLAVACGFKFVEPSSFDSTDEYLATMFAAQLVILSYGGSTCTNRFFLNPKANVLVVAHESYRSEWDPGPYGHDLFHICHSHVCPVSKQRVMLNIPDVIDETIMASIIENANAIPVDAPAIPSAIIEVQGRE
jgi:hypothetical protein